MHNCCPSHFPRMHAHRLSLSSQPPWPLCSWVGHSGQGRSDCDCGALRRCFTKARAAVGNVPGRQRCRFFLNVIRYSYLNSYALLFLLLTLGRVCQEPMVVFSTGLKPLGNDEFLVLYGAADTDVGVAKIKIDISNLRTGI